jgi:hypothetical protein
MGSKKPIFSCLAKAPLYQTPYSNFTTSFFNIFYYFIYIYLFFSQLPKYHLFSFFSSLSLSLSPSVPTVLPSFFFFRLPLLCSRPWCILPPPSFFLYPFSSVSRSARTHYQRPASGKNPHPSVQGGSLESENSKNKNKISIKISFSSFYPANQCRSCVAQSSFLFFYFLNFVGSLAIAH